MPRELAPTGEILFQGITLNEFSPDFSFDPLKPQGIDGAYIRATAGSDYTDAKFETYAARAQTAGLRTGFYHYLTAEDETSALAQTQFFARAIAGKNYTLRPAMRFDMLSGLGADAANRVAQAFLAAVEAATGATPVVYTDAESANLLWNRSIADKYPLWVVDEREANNPDAGNSPWRGWVGWQYGRSSELSGGTGAVPLSRFTAGILKSQIIIPETPPQTPDDGTKIICVTVAYGDTLSAIARVFNISVSDIAALNAIENPNRIFPGQRLYLRVDNSVPYACCEQYIVRPGDTLTGIAARFGIPWKRIAAINELSDPDLIFPGQTFKLGLC